MVAMPLEVGSTKPTNKKKIFIYTNNRTMYRGHVLQKVLQKVLNIL